MSKWYGSLTNRIEEGCQFVNEIKVGTGMTEYMWSDRHPYEVVEVINQEDVKVRALDHKRIDNNGMSECQEYEYISNTNYPIIHVVKRNNGWNKLEVVNKEELMQEARKIVESGKGIARDDYDVERRVEIEYGFMLSHLCHTPSQRQRVEEGKTVKVYTKWNNISFGVAEYYYDFSF